MTANASTRPASLPPDFAAAADEAWARMSAATGFLSEDEGRFLALAAAATPARGVILEIGSFKGRSTVGLASIARRYHQLPVVAVDPHTSPSETDPDLYDGQTTTFDDFTRTIEQAGLAPHVEVHRAFSQDLAPTWTRPIRLLWIDGDHTYAGAKADLDMFLPHLVPGGVVAFHDALHNYDGPLRVFVDDVLASDDFGMAGFCDSIAWAQYLPGHGGTPAHRQRRRRLARTAAPLAALFDERAPKLTGMRKQRYRLWRALTPHGAVDPVEWSTAISAGAATSATGGRAAARSGP
jgi:predicted O-methyltransferase YrrM